jgi:signal transduction histidine kinase
MAYLFTLQFVTTQITKAGDNQVKVDLTQALEGAAAGVDVDMLLDLAENGEPNEEGFSDDPRYVSLMTWLDTIHSAEPDAWPYLYIPAEQEGHVYFVVDLWAIYEQDSSSGFMELYKSNSGYILIGLEEQTYRAVDSPLVNALKRWSKSLEESNENSESWLAAQLWNFAEWLTETNLSSKRDFGTYGDQFGRWASGYMPLENDAGEKVAGIGVDFQADLINHIRDEAQTTIESSFFISYLIIMPLVLLVSVKITRPISELSEAAEVIGNNHHPVELPKPSNKPYRDELDVLEQVLYGTYLKLQNANQQLQGLSHQLISDREQYRQELARDLHDNVLSYLSVLSSNQPTEFDPEAMQENYRQVIARLRATIFSLRSPMMEYGLSMAIEDFIDHYESQIDQCHPKVCVEISPSEARFDPTTETHVFRIIQQAFENAIEHSKASEITISGVLSEELIEVAIQDDGKGIAGTEQPTLDFNHYEARRKFGMVGMVERAALIGAELEILPGSNGGTIIHLIWKP